MEIIQNDIGSLLSACKKGNQRAQMQLYRQFSSAMYNTAYRILGNADDAEDALQEGFITAFEKLDEVPIGGGIGMGIRESDGELKAKFDEAITQMKENGSLNALIKQWFGPDQATY